MEQRGEKPQASENTQNSWLRAIVEATKCLKQSTIFNRSLDIHIDSDKIDFKRDPLKP